MNDEKDVEHQLDELFNGDFIEVDSDSIKDIIEKKEMNESLGSRANISYADSVKEEKITKEIKQVIADDEEKKEEVKNSDAVDEKLVIKKVKEKKLKKKKTIKVKLKKLIIPVIVIVIIIFIILLTSYINNKERKYTCSLKISDKNYKITDNYDIIVKNKMIMEINSKYSYESLNDEYNKQIEFIKAEKLPVIINSNGLPGFTYIYEESTSSFTVNAYLVFSEFDIGKKDLKSKPLTYFTLKKNLKYKDLKHELESNGYTCK